MLIRRTWCWWTLLGLLLTTGCSQSEWDKVFKKEKDAQPEPSPRMVSKSQATVGTIGELVTIDGLRLLQVRGFGLVVDLTNTGGGDAPEPVRQAIMKEIRRRQTTPEANVSPVDILKGRDIAIVEVSGLVPAAAEKGDTFDVVVRALGTQTTSLAGGRLYLCDLKPFAETIQAVLDAKTVATAEGPLFISPIGLEKEIPTKIDLRKGLVLGGGKNTRPRTVRLVLNDPSPSNTRRIVDRLNGRYTKDDPLAKAKDAGSIELIIPPEWRERKRVFLEQVLHTTLNPAPGVLEKRAKDLVTEIEHPDAEFESIGCAWEAIGRTVLPIIREVYNSPLPAASYFAGRTGLRLGDNAGMEVVGRHALDPKSSYRQQAIEELGYATNIHGAGEYLRKLLDDTDTPTRIRAYECLRRRVNSAIESKALYEDKLALDTVDSNGPYMVYVKRSLAPRIAIFGKEMRCRPPVMYPADRRDDRFLHAQISAEADADNLTVFCKNKHNGMTSPPLTVSLNVVEMLRFLGGAPTRDPDGALEGLALPYDELVDILYTFCQAKSIPAEFQAEDLTGSESSQEISQERKESEL